ncbi:olfactory receptor 5AP2-like isoform X2 [Pleurodeles waltl]|uniref:olfactory receptor 5AP2-like isoform X2 n=1 Tax=Pleurodeles waltl TaxID=8319 RepID=UPI0037099136
MTGENRTSVMEFILLGLSEEPRLQIPLFLFFLIVYIITLVGNISIMTLISMSLHLHTPMYFLLCNLSFVDLCYSSVVTPNMLVNIQSKKKTISHSGCIAQMFFFVTMGSSEVFLLALMAYDRYVAICNPLLYAAIMTKARCMYLVVGVYMAASINSLIHTLCTASLIFCGSNMVTHYFCDIPPLLKLSCSDTSLNVVMLVFVAGGLIVSSLVFIIISYLCIAYAIIKISSAGGRWRAFSTCSSHFMCVTLFFGTLVFMYVRPSSKYSLEQDRVASVFYTIIIPMLNPLIYSLRNKEVKDALRKVRNRMSS